MAARTGDATDTFVGQQIRIARQASGMSQTELGNAIGVTFQQVQKYEKGTNRVAPGRLQKLADRLGQPVTYFFPEKGGDSNSAARDMLYDMHGFNIARDFARVPEKHRKSVANAFATIVECVAGPA